MKNIRDSQTAAREEYETRQKELEALCNPVMAKLYATADSADPAAGAGGMPGGMPCGKPGAAARFGASDEGPKIEEVD